MTNTSCALVVVGGGTAGAAAALAYREAGGTGVVVVLSDESAMPYRRPPLSKGFLRGEVPLEDMPLNPASKYEEDDVTVTLDAAVAALDTNARTVTTEAGDTYTYDRCVIATGAGPVVLPVPGGDDARVRALRTLPHSSDLHDAAAGAEHVVVVGSGFIGCEAAASLVAMGKTVTQVSDEATPHATRLGADTGSTIAGWLTAAGVTLVGGATVTGIENGTTVLLDGREPITGDLVLTAVGATPLGAIGDAAGLDTHDGRIVVDEHMATSAPGVYAAGDVAYARNATAGRHLAVEHWNDAVAMGKVAGTSAAGGDASWDAVPGFFSDIAEHHLDYAAWGDGYDEAHFVDHGNGAFTVWYGQDGTTVGVLTCDTDDGDRGKELIAQGAPLPE